MRDGVRPPRGSMDPTQQYDTYRGGEPRAEDWFGYAFERPQLFTRVIFQEGMTFLDGGWFSALKLQALQGDTWVDVPEVLVTPEYPALDDAISYDTYTFSFPAIRGRALRLFGTPGGSARFVSVAELRVEAIPEAATRVRLLAP